MMRPWSKPNGGRSNMSDNVVAALRLITQLQAELARVTECARAAAAFAADSEARCQALVQQLIAERDSLLERLGNG